MKTFDHPFHATWPSLRDALYGNSASIRSQILEAACLVADYSEHDDADDAWKFVKPLYQLLRWREVDDIVGNIASHPLWVTGFKWDGDESEWEKYKSLRDDTAAANLTASLLHARSTLVSSCESRGIQANAFRGRRPPSEDGPSYESWVAFSTCSLLLMVLERGCFLTSGSITWFIECNQYTHEIQPIRAVDAHVPFVLLDRLRVAKAAGECEVRQRKDFWKAAIGIAAFLSIMLLIEWLV